jgi:hypothetical protein
MTTGGAGYDLSVVVSTHDRPLQLREAIAAIRAQDHPGPIETIVVWDRAEPEPDLAVPAEVDAHRPVHVLVNDRTPGLPGSRNCGAAAATAPVLGFCDDDDLWLPSKARRQLDLLATTGSDTVVCGLELEVDGTPFARPGSEPLLRYAHLLRSRRIEANMVAALVRTAAFWDEIGPLDEHIPGGFAGTTTGCCEPPPPAGARGGRPVDPGPLGGAVHFRQQWPSWEAALRQVVDRNPEFSGEPRGRARVDGQIAGAIAAQGRRRDALRQIRTTLGWSMLEPRAAIALAIVAGVPAERLAAALNRRGHGI